jgi:hypothetical protein
VPSAPKGTPVWRRSGQDAGARSATAIDDTAARAPRHSAHKPCGVDGQGAKLYVATMIDAYSRLLGAATGRTQTLAWSASRSGSPWPPAADPTGSPE